MSEESRQPQEPQKQEGGGEQRPAAEQTPAEPKAAPQHADAVEEAKKAIHDTTEKAIHAGEEVVAAAEKLGIRKTPVNLCKTLFALGVLLYFVSSFWANFVATRARAAQSAAQLYEMRLNEVGNISEGYPARPPNPEREGNWGYWAKKDGDVLGADVPESEKKWYDEQVKSLPDKDKQWQLGKRREESRRYYEMLKDFYREGTTPKQAIQDRQKAAREKLLRSGPSTLGVMIRYLAVLAMVVGAIGILFLGTEVEKAGALIVLGLGLMRVLMT